MLPIKKNLLEAKIKIAEFLSNSNVQKLVSDLSYQNTFLYNTGGRGKDLNSKVYLYVWVTNFLVLLETKYYYKFLVITLIV